LHAEDLAEQIEKAIQLEPPEPLFADSLAYLRQ
jgi:hypothetical protein